MAATLPQSTVGPTGIGRATTERRALTWRLAATALLGISVALFVIGTAWDIQWHTNVGRDRVLTRPHVLMLGGIALGGLTSLLLILRESYRVWRGLQRPAADSLRLGVFHAPLGLAVAGFGALLGAIAFPLDDYWHTLYGIDVTLWAPFHVMIISSVIMIGLGALYTQAATLRSITAERALPAQAGLAALLALTLAALLLFLPQANVAEGLMEIGSTQIVLYPVLVALWLPLGLVSALWVTRRPGMATLTALVFLLLRQLLFWLIPWLMQVTVAAEGLSLRASATEVVITPYAYPLTIGLAALLLDVIYGLARRRGHERRALLIGGAAAVLLPALLDRPWAATMTAWYYPGLDTGAALLHTLPLIALGAALGTAAAAGLSHSLAASAAAERA